MQETQEIWVQSLGQEDPLEEKMATHSSKWQRYWSKNPMDQEAWRTAVLGVAKSQTQLTMHTHTHTRELEDGVMRSDCLMAERVSVLGDGK